MKRRREYFAPARAVKAPPPRHGRVDRCSSHRTSDVVIRSRPTQTEGASPLELLSALSRWIHVLAGIVWIGMLYFFNFVNIPFQGTQDGDTKKKVNPELLPRALFWFRWGAAWTWLTGVILLQLVFWGGHITVDPMRGWSPLGRRDAGARVRSAVHLRPAREGAQEPEGLRRGRVLPAVRRDLPDALRGLHLPRLQHPPGLAPRHDHGVERVVPDLARAAEDPAGGQGRHSRPTRPSSPWPAAAPATTPTCRWRCSGA